MSTDNTNADKAHDAGKRAKDAVDGAVHDAGQAIRGGVELFKTSVEDVKEAVGEKLHHDKAEADRKRREAALSANEHVVTIADDVERKAQANVDRLK